MTTMTAEVTHAFVSPTSGKRLASCLLSDGSFFLVESATAQPGDKISKPSDAQLLR